MLHHATRHVAQARSPAPKRRRTQRLVERRAVVEVPRARTAGTFFIASSSSSLSEGWAASAASWLIPSSASDYSFSSAAFSSSSVCCSRSAASVWPIARAQATRVPYAAIS